MREFKHIIMTILGALIILIFFTPEPRGWGEEGEEGVDEGVGVKCKYTSWNPRENIMVRHQGGAKVQRR